MKRFVSESSQANLFAFLERGFKNLRFLK